MCNAGRAFRVLAQVKHHPVSEDGSKSKRVKVAGQQVPAAAQFSTPVDEVQQLLHTHDQSAGPQQQQKQQAPNGVLDDIVKTAKVNRKPAKTRLGCLWPSCPGCQWLV